jgi:hypothetical protein
MTGKRLLKAERLSGLTIAGIALLLAACSASGQLTRSRALEQIKQSKEAEKSPSEVIKAFFLAAKEGRCSEAMTYLSAGTVLRLKRIAGASQQFPAAFELLCNKFGDIDEIQTQRQEVHGERATVYFRVYSKGRETPVLNYGLIRERGKWKIILPE